MDIKGFFPQGFYLSPDSHKYNIQVLTLVVPFGSVFLILLLY